MYPAETSLIPATLSLVDFLEEHGLKAFIAWYPNWYLGVPFKYLVGPIFPLIIVFLHNIFKNDLFTLTIFFSIFSNLLGAVGWGIFSLKISRNKLVGIATFLLLLVFPWRSFYSLTLADPSLVLAKNILPFVLLSYWIYQTDSKKILIPIAASLLVFLINTQIIPSLLVGVISVGFSKSFIKIEKTGVRKFINLWQNTKRIFFPLVISFLLSTLWYGFSYWITILANPSIGGASLMKVVLRIFDLLREGLPFILALSVVYFLRRINSRYLVFAFVWILSFSFLTFYRLISDINFWQDWTSWIWEVEVGIALFISGSLSRTKSFSYFLVLIVLVSVPFYFTYRAYIALGKPSLISKEIPNGVLSLQKLSGLAGNSRVFISGSDVFWADALYHLRQVRGGNDSVSINPIWSMASYQIREGEDSEITKYWLDVLGVKYVLVHTDVSKNYYHDFKNLDKWKNIGVKMWEGNGDIIYEVDGVKMAYSSNEGEIRNLKKPINGADLNGLKSYVNLENDEVEIQTATPYPINLVLQNSLDSGKVIIVKESYSKMWHSPNPSIKISSDTYGNILLSSNNGFEKREINLVYY